MMLIHRILLIQIQLEELVVCRAPEVLVPISEISQVTIS